jgi:hypothetical protein
MTESTKQAIKKVHNKRKEGKTKYDAAYNAVAKTEKWPKLDQRYYWERDTDDSEWDGTLRYGNEVLKRTQLVEPKNFRWNAFNYRASHSAIKLHPSMLEDGYQKLCDGKIITFDGDYIQWRLAKLLEPLTPDQRFECVTRYLDSLGESEDEQ